MLVRIIRVTVLVSSRVNITYFTAKYYTFLL